MEWLGGVYSERTLVHYEHKVSEALGCQLRGMRLGLPVLVKILIHEYLQ